MKNILIYIYLTLFPVLGWAQNVYDFPKPSNSNGWIVTKERKKGKIQNVRIGYDNHSKYEYIQIKADSGNEILAVERVIFEYDPNGLNIFAYIPQKKDRYLNFKVLREISVNMLQSSDLLELYRVDSVSVTKNLVDSVTKNKVGTAIIKSIKKYDTEIEGSSVFPMKYSYTHVIYPQILRDYYRSYKRPKWYFEVGGVIGFSYRTVQVVNALPDRQIYKSRLREEKTQFSWSGSVRGGYHVGINHSVYAGLIYFLQQFQSAGKIDWNSGLVLKDTGDMTKNRFDYWGTEIGYSYMTYRKRNGMSVDIGVDLLWAKNRNSTHKFNLGPHIAIGPKFRIGAGADLRIMPTFYYNMRSLEKHKSGELQQELATRMFTTGIKMNIRWN